MFMRLLLGRKVLVPGRGTTLSQIGHVDDEARAMRLMALNPRTYGEIYNVTGKDYFSDEGYVDTCANAVGVQADKLFVPAEVMDELSGDHRRPLIQRLAPYIHRWDESTVFGMSKLRRPHRLRAGVHVRVGGGADVRVVHVAGAGQAARLRLLVGG